MEQHAQLWLPMFTDGGDVGSGTRVRGGRVEKLFKAHIIVVGVAVVVSDTVPAKERRALTIGE